MNTDRISIKQAVALSGLSESYVRKAVSKGDLKVTKEFIGESKIEKNWIAVEDFEAWRAESGTHSKREDGRNKFVLYMTPEEAEKLQKMVAGETFAQFLSRANVKPAAEPEAE